MTNSFEITSPFFGNNSTYIEELYERYLSDPSSVDESWRNLFREATNGASAPAKRNASWAQITTKVIGAEEPKEEKPATGKDKGKKPAAGGMPQEQVEAFAHDSIRAIMMVRAYRVRG